MILAWIFKVVSGKGFSPQGNPLRFNFASSMGMSLIAIALLIVLTILVQSFSRLKHEEVFFSRFVQQIFLMYVITEIVQSRKRLYGVLSVLSATLFFVGMDVMVQHTWGTSLVHHSSMITGRVTGPMNHPNDLGTLLVTVLPVVMVLMFAYRRWKVLLAVLFILLTIALGLTDSRGAWIALATSMIALGIYLKLNTKLVITIFCALAIFFTVFGILYCMNTRWDLFNISTTKGPVSIIRSCEMLFNSTNLERYFSNQPAGNCIGRQRSMSSSGILGFGCGYSAYVQTLKGYAGWAIRSIRITAYCRSWRS